MEEVHVREAWADDKEAVLGIHDNVYEGSDYLPVYYDYFIASTDITPFVLLHQEKIIGFSAAHILDEGQTLVTRASRLNPDYEGKGLYGHLDKSILEWAKSKHVATKAFTAADANTSITKSSFQLILSRNNRVYSVEAEEIKLETASSSALWNNDLTIVSESIMAMYLKSKIIKPYLFPKDRIIVDYVPFKLLESNIPFVTGPAGLRTVFSDVTTDNNRCAGLLTSLTMYPCVNPSFHCTAEMYGTDERSIDKHVRGLMEVVKQKTNGLVRILVVHEKTVSPELLDEAFLKYGAPRLIWRDPKTCEELYREGFMFEKEL